MSGELEYREFEVPPGLTRYVRCAWRLRGQSRQASIDTIYPDGCCELIAHRSQPPRWQSADQSWRSQGSTLFAGQFRTAIRLEWKGEIDCLGLRLQPAAAGACIDGSLPDLRDQVVDLEPLNHRLCEQLRSAPGSSNGVSFSSAWWAALGDLIVTRTIDATIESAASEMRRLKGDCAIDGIARASGLSPRSFQYRFLNCVGLTAKEFARIMRLQATLRFLDGTATRLAEVAAESGFSDESHANRELRRVTGLTPARLRAALKTDREGAQTIRMAAAFIRGGRS